MLIEVIKLQDAPNTEKGNLLEELAAEFLKTQGYEVLRQVRVIASELDLLCKHKVSGKEIYVECKAHRDTLSANALTKILGIVDFKEYSEGWLVTTGPFGKDAKGFMEEWEKKKPEKRIKLSIYTSDRILNALLDARVIICPPYEKAAELIRELDLSTGDWVLLITPWGKFWLCPILLNGIAQSMTLFCAQSGRQIVDANVFDKIKLSDFSLRELEFLNFASARQSIENIAQKKPRQLLKSSLARNGLTTDQLVQNILLGEKKRKKNLCSFLLM